MTESPATPAAPPAALRSDARRNWTAILAAAATVFAERGEAADVREIAVAAGVGIGTIYRNFGTKEGLAQAVLDDVERHWADRSVDLLSRPDPWEAVAGFMAHTLSAHASNRWLRDYFSTCMSVPADLHGRYLGVVEPALQRTLALARAAGVIEPAIGPDDIALMLVSCGATISATVSHDEEPWRRALQIVLEGLRPWGR